MADVKKGKTETTVKDKDGKEAKVEIDVAKDGKTTLTVGDEKRELTGVKAAKDGKTVTGTTDGGLIVGDVAVTITIDCDKKPPELRVKGIAKKGTKLEFVAKDDVFTLKDHKEQDRLLDFIKKRQLPQIAAAKVKEKEILAALDQLERAFDDARDLVQTFLKGPPRSRSRR